ncbi:MAG: SdrD B-like domain-containing protein, partial [Enterococcus hulanensis]
TNSRGDPLEEGREVTVVNNSNGTTTLIWTLEGLNPSEGHVAEVNFETTPVLKNLAFNSASIASARVVTGGEIWLQDNPSISDTTNASLRSSAGAVNLYQMQQIVLTKEVDKSFVEVGNKDDALSESDQKSLTDITYKISLENYSSDKLLNVKVVDELPYDGDDFGTDFDGSYTVKEIKITDGSGDITYSNDPVTPVSPIKGIDDPNKIGGVWGGYVPGVSNSESIKNAKAFLVTAKELAVGEKLVFEVTISPNGQKPGNIYRNRAAFNSAIDLPVRSNIVQTQVLGRDLTGYVWYDDDYNGLINSGEDPVGNIPVKLYRTSLVNGSYVKQLVKKSLTDQSFIDGAGDSLIKTGSDGKYKFENLPEGEYLAEFMVGDIVVTRKVAIVTKPLIGTDPTLNSKADPDTFKTPEYNQPELNDLPTLLTGTDKVHHVTDVNAGLTRLSKIRLFKYEEGTVIDADGDGKLSDEEIEASTTNALE